MGDVKRIGIFGGSFDPIHRGHVDCALRAREAAHLDEVLIVPTNVSPFKTGQKVFFSNEDRLAMCVLATDSHEGFSVVASEVERGGVSYTVDTVDALCDAYGKENEYFLIVGTDEVPELHAWKDVARLVEMVTFIVVERPGQGDKELAPSTEEPSTVRVPDTLGTPLALETSSVLEELGVRYILVPGEGVDVSATQLRANLDKGAWSACEPFLDEEVYEFIVNEYAKEDGAHE